MNNLKQWLDTQGMTQKQLAERIGMTETHVSRICNGFEPGGEFMWKFFSTFGQAATTAAFSNGNNEEQAQ